MSARGDVMRLGVHLVKGESDDMDYYALDVQPQTILVRAGARYWGIGDSMVDCSYKYPSRVFLSGRLRLL